MSEESTTPDLVELWHQSADAVVRRDYKTAMSIFAADSVWEVRPLGMTFEGRAATRRFLEDWIEDYEGYEREMLEGHDLGNGVVFTIERQDARPPGSPTMVHERWAFTVEWEAGMVVRVTGDRDIDEARAAAEALAESRG
jgi:ketosteroid isomerase-like protein